MRDTPMETRDEKALKILDSLKPDLLRILSNAPAYGSCGFEVCFHNSEIVKLVYKAEIKKAVDRPSRIEKEEKLCTK
jgi:hypothetical protein